MKFENTDRNILSKLIVSNVISAFLDHLKPIFFNGQLVVNIECHLLFKISGSTPVLGSSVCFLLAGGF